MSNLFAAAWLLGLFAAAPLLRTQPRYAFVHRLRDALILGVAIPLILAFVHALYAAALWATLFVCIALALLRRFPRDKAAGVVPYLTITALVAVTWPQIVRPLLEGDSLWYHLPNAASWVQSHSLWTSATHYWWYPPASELFASGLYAVSTPFALPWCGAGALALLGFRTAAWAREAFDVPLLADAIAAATVTAYPLAIQGGTLQNDVWLAAFWLEALWLLRTRERGAAAPAIALTVLLKPQGWLFAAIALAVRRAPLQLWLVGTATFAVWLLHDAFLWHGAGVRSAGSTTDLMASAILAHGRAGLPLLARVMVALSPFALLALCAALLRARRRARRPRIGVGRMLGRDTVLDSAVRLRLERGATCNGSIAALCGACNRGRCAHPRPRGAPRSCRRNGTRDCIGDLRHHRRTQHLLERWNDARGAGRRARHCGSNDRGTARTDALAQPARLCRARHLRDAPRARQPVDYYADALRVGGKASGVYDWIATTRPAAIGGWGLRLGTVNVLSPSTRTIDLSDVAPCAQARDNGTLLVAVAETTAMQPSMHDA